MTVVAPADGGCRCLVDALTPVWGEEPQVVIVLVDGATEQAAATVAAVEGAARAVTGADHGRVVVVAPVPVPQPGGTTRHGAVAGLLGGQVRALAVQLAPGATANAVLHGPVADVDRCGPACAAGTDDERAVAEAQAVTGRLVSLEEVLANVAFLASADAAYVSGTVLTVDGGVNIGRHA
jgi:NAD(P)-dependent dehydrogenase (short-subunit alcohol dehydrogenase family)